MSLPRRCSCRSSNQEGDALQVKSHYCMFKVFVWTFPQMNLTTFFAELSRSGESPNFLWQATDGASTTTFWQFGEPLAQHRACHKAQIKVLLGKFTQHTSRVVINPCCSGQAKNPRSSLAGHHRHHGAPLGRHSCDGFRSGPWGVPVPHERD